MLSISEALAIRVLTQIAQDPQMIGELLEKMGSMSNIPTSTMGGLFFGMMLYLSLDGGFKEIGSLVIAEY